MSISNEAVSALIQAGFTDAQVNVSGDGYKYHARVVSSDFKGMTKIKRHQKVYATLSESIASGELHALTIEALTPEEASKLEKK